MPTPILPIDEVIPQVIASLSEHASLVLQAPPGAGKTTRVPPALLKADVATGSGLILMLEPRRLAARTAARRMAAEASERVGQTFGYRVRFEEKLSSQTQVLVVTEGILLRRLQEDPFLENVAAVIFDEFHERRLDSDLALAMTHRIQQTVRPELRIVVMSATLNAEPVATFLGQCPVITSEGRQFPVTIRYQRPTPREAMTTTVFKGIETALTQSAGDVLVFLPGVGEIRRLQSELTSLAKQHQLSVLPLFGEMTSEEQDAVLQPGASRKVVLATNVAETSVTIEGITAVVDSGYCRQMRLDASVGLDRLELTPVSKASADQRAGRAGRTSAGLCLRMWDEATHRIRPDFETSELNRVDLSAAVLRLHAWGERDIRSFPWFEAPPESSLQHAERLLQLLGALDDERRITERGIALTAFPAAPRIGRLLLEAAALNQLPRCALLAAMLSERSPFMTARGLQNSSPRGPATNIDRSTAGSQSDVLDRLHALEEFFQTGRIETPFGTVNRGSAAGLQRVASQFVQSVPAFEQKSTSADRRSSSDSNGQSADDSDTILRKALLAAFPDRLARRREAGSEKALMVGGRGVRLARQSAVRGAELFLCIDVDGAGTDALVRQASAVDRDWLDAHSLQTTVEMFFHPTQKQVMARRRIRFADLLLEESPSAIEDHDAAAEELFQAAKNQLSVVMPQNDDSIAAFITRVRCLREWMPELGLPEMDDTQLQNVLRNLCDRCRSFRDLQKAPWLAELEGRLEYAQLQALQREAPERILVPSGNRIRLQYELGRPPVLPVRIQEVFGWAQTPTVAGGRVRVLLHLLAPNMRPQQVTDDLASFWANTYQDVRKELKRRYPKHRWPEDPRELLPAP